MRKRIIFTVILFLLVTQTGCAHFSIWETAKGGSDLAVANEEENMNYANFKLLHSIGTETSHSLEGAREAIAAGAELSRLAGSDRISYSEQTGREQSDLYTPVRIAMRVRAEEIAKELVRNGADVNLEEADGRTCLMYLVSWPAFGWGNPSDMEWLELLEEAGVDVNYVNAQGKTAMDYAAMAGSMGDWRTMGTEVMEWMVSHGAEVDGEMVAEALLAENVNYYQVEYLMEECRKRGIEWEVPAECETHFKAAFEDVKSLKQKGYDPNQMNHEKDTLLMAAACTGNIEVMKYLIHKGADMDYMNRSTSKSALCRAAEYGRYEAVELLLESGAEYLHSEEEGITALDGMEMCMAAAGGHTDVMELLFSYGYRLNEHSLNGALQCACNGGSTKAVDLLVEEAEKQGLKADFYSGSELNSAAGRHDLEMVKHLLENYHLDIGYLGMRWAVERNDVEMVELLLSYGAELNPDASQLGDNMGYLGCAASSAGLEMVQLLVEAGAEVDGRFWDGVTPVMEAANKSIRILKYLVEQGADINAKAQEGDTALIYAVHGGNRECVEYLLSLGADTEAVWRGQTAYETAVERGDEEIIRLFQKYGKDR